MESSVYLKPQRSRSVENRHPWIFAGAVERVTGNPVAGETVRVCDAKGVCLGWGSWSPTSSIRIRMLVFGATASKPDAAWVKRMVQASIARRSMAFAAEAGVRLVHGESDGLPGVTIDCYDGWCVVQLASAGAEFWKVAIVEALVEAGAKGVYNRSDVDARSREGLRGQSTIEVDGKRISDAEVEKYRQLETGVLFGEEPPALIAIREADIRYYVDIRTGHKTGFYLDQREARRLVGTYAHEREVLNCFSYTGGFGLACAKGGAKSVINLDLSKSALSLARKNFELTFGLPAGEYSPSAHSGDFEEEETQTFGGTSVSLVNADVFKQLRLYRDQGRQFDLIILDPPKFAETKAQLVRAARGYKDINLLAMKLLRPGGILATFSCSGAMDSAFFDMVCREAALDSKHSFQVIARTQQAADHPIALDFPEGFYLKGLILRRCDA